MCFVESNKSPSIASQVFHAAIFNTEGHESTTKRLPVNEFKDLRERKLQTKFVGREWLFSEMEAWLHNSQNRQVLLITGDPGVGKSALVVELVERRIEQMRSKGKAMLTCWPFTSAQLTIRARCLWASSFAMCLQCAARICLRMTSC